jgi:hypothetical protein
MRILLSLVLLAGCPGKPTNPRPVGPTLASTHDAPLPWWNSGDAACPALNAVVPGAAPGATVQAGHVRKTATDIYCEAAGGAHGPATRFYPDGKPAENGYVDRGLRVGMWTAYHPNGTIASYGGYTGGMPGGVWSTFYPSGQERDRGDRRGDQRLGLWLAWDDRGPANRDPDRFTDYGPDGKAAMHGVFVDGDPTEMLGACIIGLAYPYCRFLPVLDLGYRRDPNETKPARGKPGSLNLELGGFANLDAHHSIGATAGWIFDATYPAYIVEGRYRFWLFSWLAAEGGVGRLVGRGVADGVDGFEAHVGLVGADIAAVTLTAERHGGESIGLVGVRFGLPTLLIGAYAAAHLKN